MAWLQLVAAVVALGLLFGASISSIGSRRWLERLETMPPRPRFALIAALTLLPVGMGLLAFAVVFAPSVLDAHGVIGDHCGVHPGHDFHLCFTHGTPPPQSPLFLGVIAACLLMLGADWRREVAQAYRASSWARQLAKLSHFDPSTGTWITVTQQTLAVTVGLFRPKVFVSSHLRDSLPAPQFRTVIAHERAHVDRRDGLLKLLVRLGAYLQFSSTRRLLLEELDVASEQACDEAAAVEVGDRLIVAETILAMRRMAKRCELPVSAMGFGTTALERRVNGLLDGHCNAVGWGRVLAIVLATCGAIALTYDELHHAVEVVLSHLF